MTKSKKVDLGILLAIGLVVIGYKTNSRVADAKQNQRVWSDTYRGIALSVNPIDSQCKIGKACEVKVIAKNFGVTPVDLLITDYFGNYRVVLFRTDGTTLPRSETALKVESMTKAEKDQLPSSPIMVKLAPGDETQGLLNLNQWFKIEKAGTYNLVIMRDLYSWEDGFVISNATKIEVVENTEADAKIPGKLQPAALTLPTPALK